MSHTRSSVGVRPIAAAFGGRDRSAGRHVLAPIAVCLALCAAGCASSDGRSDGTVTATAAPGEFATPADAEASADVGAPDVSDDLVTTSPEPPSTLPTTPDSPTSGVPIDPPPTVTQTTPPPAPPDSTAGDVGDSNTTVGPTSAASPVAGPECVRQLTLRERVALLVWPSVYSADWNAAIDTVRANAVGGVLLMRPEGWTVDQLATRLAELEAASRHGLIVATDEEGGDVQRLRLLGDLPSQRTVSQELDPVAAADLIAAHGAAVRSVGVDMVLGPVVDVEPNVGEVPLQPSRFFVGPPSAVSAYAEAYVEGWSRADLFSVLKHYPGHGAASGDTHITPGVTPSFEDIIGWDLAPYRDLVGPATAGQVSVMVGHLTVPGLTDGLPATRSAAAVAYLRDDLGYGDALLMTDALGMAAVGLPEPEAAVLALQAGIDVVIFTLTSQTTAVIDALVAAVEAGQIAEAHVDAAAQKVMAMLARDGHTCSAP